MPLTTGNVVFSKARGIAKKSDYWFAYEQPLPVFGHEERVKNWGFPIWPGCNPIFSTINP
jgi:hypothetical protein